MLLVDTNILIDYLRQNPLAVSFVAQNGKGNLALSPIVVYDLELRTYNLKDFRFVPGIRVSDQLT